MVVADGVDGESAGEMASRQAIYTLLSLSFAYAGLAVSLGTERENTVMWRMKDRFRRVNATLLRDAAAHANLSRTCTTMTVAVTHGNDFNYGHIGDSRTYLLHEGKLVRLTRSHRRCALGRGWYSHTQRSSYAGVARLLQALSSKEAECNPEVYDYLLADEDQLLLCTDGLTEMVEEMDIESALNSASSAKCVEAWSTWRSRTVGATILSAIAIVAQIQSRLGIDRLCRLYRCNCGAYASASLVFSYERCGKVRDSLMIPSRT
jgi:PPM family protein phosphatase